MTRTTLGLTRTFNRRPWTTGISSIRQRTFTPIRPSFPLNVRPYPTCWQLPTKASSWHHLVSPNLVSYHGLSAQRRSYADIKTVQTPVMADSIVEGTLKTWHKKPGDFVRADQEIATVETDKVDVSITAPENGVLLEVFVEEEGTVRVGEDLYRMELKEVEESSQEVASGISKDAQRPPEKTEDIPSTPEPQPAPTTPQVTPEQTQKQRSPGAVPSTGSSPSICPTEPSLGPSIVGIREEHREKMSRMRLRIAERLKQSQNTAASLTTFNEIDMSNLISMRKQYKEAFESTHSVKLGFMSAFVKACVYAVKHVPIVNSRIEDDQVVHPTFVDISVAVATPKGLVTPVVRNCQNMGFVQVEKTIQELGEKARNSQITIEDMAGGTFSISNGGVFGSLLGTPIINPPQSAILGMHAIKPRAVVVDGKIEVRPVMFVALTYDHRLIDGREAVTFLVKVKEAVEDPRRLLLEV